MAEQPDPTEAPRSERRRRVVVLSALLAVLVGGVGYAFVHGGKDNLSLAGATQDPLTPTGVDPHYQTLTNVPRLSARDIGGPDAVARPWTLESISPDGRRLTIGYQQLHPSGCHQTNGLVVNENGKRVVVAVVTLFDNFKSGVVVCTGPLDTVQTVITLKAPLGHRQLFHLPVT